MRWSFLSKETLIWYGLDLLILTPLFPCQGNFEEVFFFSNVGKKRGATVRLSNVTVNAPSVLKHEEDLESVVSIMPEDHDARRKWVIENSNLIKRFARKRNNHFLFPHSDFASWPLLKMSTGGYSGTFRMIPCCWLVSLSMDWAAGRRSKPTQPFSYRQRYSFTLMANERNYELTRIVQVIIIGIVME